MSSFNQEVIMKKILALIIGVITLNTVDAQWIKSNAPDGYWIWGMAANDTNCYAAIWTQGIYRSNDNGLSWSEKNNGLNNLQIKCLEITDSYVYAAGWSVSRSNDHGENWTEVNNGLTSLYTYSLAHDENFTYVGSLGGLVFYSANNGDQWNPIPISGINSSIMQLVVLDTMLFAGTDNNGIFRTSDNGAHWEPINNGLTNLWILALGVSGTTLYAGTYFDKFFISTDYGENWINSTGNLPLAPDNTVSAIAFDDSIIIVGLSRGGVYISQDHGASWQRINEGLSNLSIMSLAVSVSNLIAGTVGSGIWYRPLSDIYNYLNIPAGDIAPGFSLSQNYPNPVNSGTTICFSLPYRTYTTLKIFDQSGSILASLVDGFLASGSHKVFFDGGCLPNGIYYYTLTSGSYTQTRALAVIR
jgi:photosystem II stability/assembly factor-like uncharacterized protein